MSELPATHLPESILDRYRKDIRARHCLPEEPQEPLVRQLADLLASFFNTGHVRETLAIALNRAGLRLTKYEAAGSAEEAAQP